LVAEALVAEAQLIELVVAVAEAKYKHLLAQLLLLKHIQ
jgi:hypothetical protein